MLVFPYQSHLELLFRRNLQRLIRGYLHPDSCGSKYEPLSYHVFHHRTYSKWDCIGGAQKILSEVRTPRHLLLLDATLMRFYYLKLKNHNFNCRLFLDCKNTSRKRHPTFICNWPYAVATTAGFNLKVLIRLQRTTHHYTDIACDSALWPCAVLINGQS